MRFTPALALAFVFPAACASNVPAGTASDAMSDAEDSQVDAPLQTEDASIATIDAARDAVADATNGTDDAAGDAANDAANDTAIDAVSDAVNDAGPAPSFASIYTEILVPRCARCHDRVEWNGGFRMPDVATAYRELVDVPVATRWITLCAELGHRPTPIRVRPGDLASSALAYLPECYVRDAEHDTLTPDELARLRAWISAGAPASGF